MIIDASLFAHIQNDAFLSGTYKLQGNRFKNTVGYLNEYVNSLKQTGEGIQHAKLMQDLAYLGVIEDKMDKCTTDKSVKPVAQFISKDLEKLDKEANISMLGGWCNQDGGHAMIYQFTRNAEGGYLFTVVNAGAGLEYHSKKTHRKKELYNPTKVWSIPRPATINDELEIEKFIERLLQARVPPSPVNPKQAVDAQVLYETILTSMSYIQGEELDEDKAFPEHGYTGGQLAGTCAQRCIHQMLKINSKSEKDYQSFIFKFKLHALIDYTGACLAKKQPFNAGVADQINLAIDNNLKILNTPGLFTPTEFNGHFAALTKLKQEVAKTPFNAKKEFPEPSDNIPGLTLNDNTCSTSVNYSSNAAFATSKYTKVKSYSNFGLFENLRLTLEEIGKITDFPAQYVALEKLILSLPLSQDGNFDPDFYKQLSTVENCEVFQGHLNNIQGLLNRLRTNWLKDSQNPTFNHLCLSILSLQTDTHTRIEIKKIIAKKSEPSFAPFTTMMMNTLIGNHERDPFEATNNAVVDERINLLKKRARKTTDTVSDAELRKYFQDILNTEPSLNEELKSAYQQKYNADSSMLHKEIRTQGLESLHMIAEHLNCPQLNKKFDVLIEKIQAQLAYESELRRAIDPFFVDKLYSPLKIGFSYDILRIFSPLYSIFVPYQDLSTTVTKHKYNLKDSPARDALEADISKYSAIKKGLISVKTDNAIQLQPAKGINEDEGPRKVVESDIIARDYLHLRREPKFQIALTLDYFYRHVDMLADVENQRYVEANLFQPGLLLNSLTGEHFLPQFDKFLENGKRFFAHNGEHTRESLLFFRLDFLVSRYSAQTEKVEGISRLKTFLEDILKQLSLATDPEVTYVLHQYLFLTLIERMNAGGYFGKLFEQAVKSYFYLMGHTNPLILQDTAHSIELETAAAKFKIIACMHSEPEVKKAVEQSLIDSGLSLAKGLTGTFPNYRLVIDPLKTLEINALQGKVYEKGLAKSGLPLAIQSHPLIKQLGLDSEHECLMNADGTYLTLKCQEGSVHLLYRNDTLIVHKDWLINGKTVRCELQALTAEHEAGLANPKGTVIKSNLSGFLTDGSMNYWKDTSFSGIGGILVRNNVPIYLCKSGKITTLDETGKDTNQQLTQFTVEVQRLFNAFESTRFIHLYTGADHHLVTLPRFGLGFRLDKKENAYINQATGERLVASPSPVHPAVAGLVLQKNDQQRVLVPVARFYETERGAIISDFHPVAHDKNNVVAAACLDAYWKSNPTQRRLLWDYQDSEQCVSFQLRNGEPVADTSADALYLAYMYLVTNQTEKAWKTLEDCNARLGGLKGDPAELKYISWICKSLPFTFPDEKKQQAQKVAIRDTPPFVACQLKAMSLLTDYLAQDRKFTLEVPDVSDHKANSRYAHLQYEEATGFLHFLPATIYLSFCRLQTMGRHLEHGYKLSKIERKRLLDYYQQSSGANKAPLGALGYEWMQLSLEALLEEKDALQAHQATGESLSLADKTRLTHIEKQLKKLQAVKAKSTKLELVAIDLSLPPTIHTDKPVFKLVQEKFDSTQFLTNNHFVNAIKALASDMSDEEFIAHLPAYLKIASSKTHNSYKALLDFCIRTLLAKRHTPLAKQDSAIPLLCNVLYRIAHKEGHSTPAKFIELIKQVNQPNQYSFPPLRVYQAVDVYQKILAEPETLIAEYERQEHTPIRTTALPKQSLIKQTGIDAKLVSSLGVKKSFCDELFTEYQKIEAKLALELQALGKIATKDMDHEFAIEEEAGKKLLAAEKDKKVLVQRLMSDTHSILAIQKSAQEATVNLQSQKDELWKAAVLLANQGPDDLARARTWRTEKEARVRPTLTLADLMSLYTKADLAFSIEKTGLSAKDAQKLHDAIHNALVHDIRHQSAVKISAKLNEAITDGTISSALIALDLLARTEIPALDTPVIVILQHEEQILLNKRQVSALEELLAPSKEGRGFNEVVEKIIMGGGKSKVILPILAEMKARGDNLVIVEVPQALLETNHEDLNRVSQRLYGKRAYRFDFNRDSNCSSERLEQIYNQFVEIMTTKGYLITTGEAMQSLELKYVELLLTSTELDATWEKQVEWLDKITGLVRHYGDCIIDEGHQGLSIKKRLNYTSADVSPISPDLIRDEVGLFKLIDPEFIKNAPFLGKDYDWDSFKTELATKLVTATTSPLRQFVTTAVQKYGDKVKDEVVAYLTNTAEEISPAVLAATDEEKETLAVMKQEVSVLLQQTLNRHLDEHYGASKREDLSPIEQTLALPYIANNIVNERSRFGNQLESINYAAQMMLIKGISKELLMQRIAQWQNLARQELFQTSALKHLDETPTAKGFAILAGKLGLTLSQLDVSDSKQLDTLYDYFQHNEGLIFDLLNEQTLRQIQQDSETISSNSFTHIDMYRSAQTISGTPTPTTFHQRLKYNKTCSLGTDGYILGIVADKNTRISSAGYKNAHKFIKHILKNSQNPECTRAISDIRPTFQGVSNLLVAQEIADYYRKTSNKVLKYILYFDENQVLCAIAIDNPDKPISLKTTDEKEISRILGISPWERFTYYDQAHTLGADITQDPRAHAIVLVDEKTPMQAFLQGTMRMRGIGQDQTMEIITPENLKGIQWATLRQQFAKVEQISLLNDNLTAAKLQMASSLRCRAIKMIGDLPPEAHAEKRRLALAFRSCFAEKPTSSFFELYGALNKPQATKDILQRYKEQLNERWNTCLKSANILASKEDLGLQEVINKALPNCLQEYEAAANGSFAMEVEIQAELQQQIELLVAAINDNFDPELIEKGVRYFNVFNKFYGTDGKVNSYALSLNEVCSPTQKSDLFDANLRASKIFAEVYEGQKKYTNAFLKPVFLTWYHMHEGKLQALIVTPQEAAKISFSINLYEIPDSWVATTLDTVVAGKAPEGIVNDPSYQSLREQVCFFNGEFSTLLHQETPLIWLKKHTIEKLDLFERELMPYRAGSNAGFQQIKTALSQTNIEGFAYIAQHPFDDLSQFDWKRMFPKIMQIQVAEYKRVADVFVYMNREWMKKDLSIDFLQKEFNLPLSSLEYVNSHLTKLSALKYISDYLNLLVTKNFDRPFVTAMTSEQRKTLEEVFSIPLSTLAKEYGVNLSKSGTELNASRKIDSKVLLILQAHPAFKNNVSLTLDVCKALVMKATCPEDLSAVLDINCNSTALTKSILESFYCVESVVKDILDSPDVMNETLWKAVLKRAKNATEEDQLIDLIFNKPRPALPGFVVDFILEQENVSEPRLLKLVDYATSEESFYRLFAHTALRERLLKNPNFSSKSFMVYYVKNKPEDTQGIFKLLEHPDIDLVTLKKYVISATEPAFLFTLVSHPKADADLWISTMKSPAFDIDVARNILTKASGNTKVLSELFKGVYAYYKEASFATGLLAWEDLILEICDDLRQNGKMKELNNWLKFMNINNRLWFKLLDKLGTEVFASLPLQTLINDADETQFKLLMNHEKTGNLSQDNLLFLVKKCNTSKLIKQFLGRKDLTNPVIKVVLTELSETNNKHLLQILKHNLNLEIYQLVYNHEAADKALRKMMYPFLTPEMLLPFLKSGKPIDQDELLEILKHPTAINTAVLHTVLKLPALNVALVNKILEKYDIETNVLVILAENLFNKCKEPGDLDKILQWEDCLLKTLTRLGKNKVRAIIRTQDLNSRVLFALLNIFDKEILKEQDFANMLRDATKAQLTELLKLEVVYTKDHLKILVQRVDETAQIDLLLARPEMKSTLANGLLARPEYSGKIGNWAWLTEQQILGVLDKMNDFDSLCHALMHKNLSAAARVNWLALQKQQQDANESTDALTTPREKILTVIEALKIQTCSNMIKGAKTPAYIEAARIAFGLYCDLRKATNDCFAEKKPDMRSFQQNCLRAAKDAETVLATHRGYKQAFLDIINVILAYLSFKPPRAGEKWRFFEADTNNIKTMKQVLGKTHKIGGGPEVDETADPNPSVI